MFTVMLRRTLVSLLVLLLALGLGWAAHERLFGFLDGPPVEVPVEQPTEQPTEAAPAADAGPTLDERPSPAEVAAEGEIEADMAEVVPAPPAAVEQARTGEPSAATAPGTAGVTRERATALTAPPPQEQVPEPSPAALGEAARTEQPQEPIPQPAIGSPPDETQPARPSPPEDDTTTAAEQVLERESAPVAAQVGTTPAEPPHPEVARAAPPETAAAPTVTPETPAAAAPETAAEPKPPRVEARAEPETVPEPAEVGPEGAPAEERAAPVAQAPMPESRRPIEQARLDPATSAAREAVDAPAPEEIDAPADVATDEAEEAPAPGWQPWSSLSLETIQRALSAMLGGTTDEPEASGMPDPAAGPPEPSEPVEVARAEPEAPLGAAPPQFDIVRVGPDGRAVIAGRAEPGTEVEVRSGEQVIDRVAAGRRGHWVAIPGEPLKPGDHELTLVSWRAGQRLLDSEEVVVVIVPEPPPPQPPPVATSEPPPPQPAPVAEAEAGAALAVAMPRGGEGHGRILQAPGRISGEGTLALMIVDYDERGMTRLTGEAPPGAAVRIYVDNQPAAEAVARADGQWTTVLDERLQPGTYTLRLDQLDAHGRTAARLETPFTRVSQPPIEGDVQVDYVVVQPGNSLWRIARRLFGQGMQYVHIYEANQGQIRDPDLIYPGQVFEIPKSMSVAG